MSNTNDKVTRCSSPEGINFIFVADHELKPGEWLFVDLRSDPPTFRSVPEDYDPLKGE